MANPKLPHSGGDPNAASTLSNGTRRSRVLHSQDRIVTDAISYPLDVGRKLIALGRTRAWHAAMTGELRTYLDGRSRFVTRRALLDYVAEKEASVEAK